MQYTLIYLEDEIHVLLTEILEERPHLHFEVLDLLIELLLDLLIDLIFDLLLDLLIRELGCVRRGRHLRQQQGASTLALAQLNN